MHGSPTGPCAVPIDTNANQTTNPMQPRLIDGMWLSVVKANDWNGTAVRLDVAAAPQGPWTTLQTVTVPTRTVDGRTNTYARTPHAVAVRHREPGRRRCRTTHGRWIRWHSTTPTLYQPRLFELTAPPGSLAADRADHRATGLRTDEPSHPSDRHTRGARGWRRGQVLAFHWRDCGRRCARRGDRPRCSRSPLATDISPPGRATKPCRRRRTSTMSPVLPGRRTRW